MKQKPKNRSMWRLGLEAGFMLALPFLPLVLDTWAPTLFHPIVLLKGDVLALLGYAACVPGIVWMWKRSKHLR